MEQKAAMIRRIHLEGWFLLVGFGGFFSLRYVGCIPTPPMMWCNRDKWCFSSWDPRNLKMFYSFLSWWLTSDFSHPEWVRLGRSTWYVIRLFEGTRWNPMSPFKGGFIRDLCRGLLVTSIWGIKRSWMETSRSDQFDGVDLEWPEANKQHRLATVPLLAWRQNIQMNQSFRRFNRCFFQMFYK